MNDYFGNLARRNLQAESALQPRRAALFEPTLNGETAFSEVVQTPVAEPSVVTAKVAPTPIAPAAAAIHFAVPEMTTVTMKASPALRDQVVPTKSLPMVAPAIEPRVALRTETPNALRAGLLAPLIQNLIQPTPQQEAEALCLLQHKLAALEKAALPVTTPAVTSPPAANFPPLLPAVEKVIGAEQPPITLSEKTELDAPRSAPVQPAPLLKPPVTPVLSLPLWSPASVSAAPRAPVERTINVTIGRIEIRAPHATASVKRVASAVPEVSLETYLKQRNQSQGGRR